MSEKSYPFFNENLHNGTTTKVKNKEAPKNPKDNIKRGLNEAINGFGNKITFCIVIASPAPINRLKLGPPKHEVIDIAGKPSFANNRFVDNDTLELAHVTAVNPNNSSETFMILPMALKTHISSVART